MAKAAAAQGMEALSLSGVTTSAAFGVAGDYIGEAVACDGPERMHPLDPRHWMQRELADFMGMTAEDKNERRKGVWVEKLDPDLAVMRSFSLSAKIQIQRDRNYESEMRNQHRHLLKQIEVAVKNWTGLTT